MKKNIMIKSTLSFILLCLIMNTAFSQTERVRGSIKDFQTDMPIPDAIVKYKRLGQEESRGVTTNSQGNYEFSTPYPPESIISMEVSADGYYPRQIEIIIKPGSNNIDIQLIQIEIPITREFKIQYRDPNEIFRLIQPYIDNRYGSASLSEGLRTIVVTNPSRQLETIEQKILSYDVPLKKIWLEIKLIEATGNDQEKPTYSKEIEEIAQQLNALFKFTHYELIGRANAMGLEGSVLQFANSPDETTAGLFSVHTTLEYFDNTIKLNNLNIRTRLPRIIDLITTVNVGNGETVILGASRSDPQQGSLITVVTAKVVE